MRPDPTLAIPAGEDIRSAALRIGRARESFMLSHRVAACVRPVVAASWQRCARSGTDLGHRLPPVTLQGEALARRRSRHPLAGLMPMFRDLLGDRDHIFAVTDATGTLLWVEGAAATLQRASRMNFVAGATWSEAAAGTNAPGTALAAMRPVQIVAAEHYNTLVRPWSCAAEAELGRRDVLLKNFPEPGTIRLTALGRDNAVAEFDGRVVHLRPRHSEIAVILALAADGLHGPRLAVKLSEAEIHPVTLRAEMSRLRALLGNELLGSHPYRLRGPVVTDFTGVLDLLDQGRITDAMVAYAGPLLPGSQAPAIVEHRMVLERELRTAVLASGDAMTLRRWLHSEWGANDEEAWRALSGAA
jgi:hypothetical protein